MKKKSSLLLFSFFIFGFFVIREIRKSPQQNETNLKQSGKIAQKLKTHFDYASSATGGRILDSSKNVQHAASILKEDKDKYLLSRGNQPFFVVIELSDEVLIDTIIIECCEYFATIPSQIRIFGAKDYPTQNWIELINSSLKYTRSPQVINIQEPKWATIVRIDVLSLYGEHKYAAITSVKIFGKSQLDVFKDETILEEEEEEKDERENSKHFQTAIEKNDIIFNIKSNSQTEQETEPTNSNSNSYGTQEFREDGVCLDDDKQYINAQLHSSSSEMEILSSDKTFDNNDELMVSEKEQEKRKKERELEEQIIHQKEREASEQTEDEIEFARNITLSSISDDKAQEQEILQFTKSDESKLTETEMNVQASNAQKPESDVSEVHQDASTEGTQSEESNISLFNETNTQNEREAEKLFCDKASSNLQQSSTNNAVNENKLKDDLSTESEVKTNEAEKNTQNDVASNEALQQNASEHEVNGENPDFTNIAQSEGTLPKEENEENETARQIAQNNKVDANGATEIVNNQNENSSLNASSTLDSKGNIFAKNEGDSMKEPEHKETQDGNKGDVDEAQIMLQKEHTNTNSPMDSNHLSAESDASTGSAVDPSKSEFPGKNEKTAVNTPTSSAEKKDDDISKTIITEKLSISQSVESNSSNTNNNLNAAKNDFLSSSNSSPLNSSSTAESSAPSVMPSASNDNSANNLNDVASPFNNISDENKSETNKRSMPEKMLQTEEPHIQSQSVDQHVQIESEEGSRRVLVQSDNSAVDGLSSNNANNTECEKSKEEITENKLMPDKSSSNDSPSPSMDSPAATLINQQVNDASKDSSASQAFDAPKNESVQIENNLDISEKSSTEAFSLNAAASNQNGEISRNDATFLLTPQKDEKFNPEINPSVKINFDSSPSSSVGSPSSSSSSASSSSSSPSPLPDTNSAFTDNSSSTSPPSPPSPPSSMQTPQSSFNETNTNQKPLFKDSPESNQNPTKKINDNQSSKQDYSIHTQQSSLEIQSSRLPADSPTSSSSSSSSSTIDFTDSNDKYVASSLSSSSLTPTNENNNTSPILDQSNKTVNVMQTVNEPNPSLIQPNTSASSLTSISNNSSLTLNTTSTFVRSPSPESFPNSFPESNITSHSPLSPTPPSPSPPPSPPPPPPLSNTSNTSNSTSTSSVSAPFEHIPRPLTQQQAFLLSQSILTHNLDSVLKSLDEVSGFDVDWQHTGTSAPFQQTQTQISFGDSQGANFGAAQSQNANVSSVSQMSSSSSASPKSTSSVFSLLNKRVKSLRTAQKNMSHIVISLTETTQNLLSSYSNQIKLINSNNNAVHNELADINERTEALQSQLGDLLAVVEQQNEAIKAIFQKLSDLDDRENAREAEKREKQIRKNEEYQKKLEEEVERQRKIDRKRRKVGDRIKKTLVVAFIIVFLPIMEWFINR